MNNTKRYVNKNGRKFRKADKGNKPKKEIKDYQFFTRTKLQQNSSLITSKDYSRWEMISRKH